MAITKNGFLTNCVLHNTPLFFRCVPSHLPGSGKPPWAEDGQSCFRREGEESVRSYKTAKIENIAKPGRKRLDVAFNTNNNNSTADLFLCDDNNNNDGNVKNGRRKFLFYVENLVLKIFMARLGSLSYAPKTKTIGSWTNRRYQAGVRLGELEADFREARRGREETAAKTAAAQTASLADSAPVAGNGVLEGYLPSSPTAPRRHSPKATTPLPPEA